MRAAVRGGAAWAPSGGAAEAGGGGEWGRTLKILRAYSAPRAPARSSVRIPIQRAPSSGAMNQFCGEGRARGWEGEPPRERAQPAQARGRWAGGARGAGGEEGARAGRGARTLSEVAKEIVRSRSFPTSGSSGASCCSCADGGPGGSGVEESDEREREREEGNGCSSEGGGAARRARPRGGVDCRGAGPEVREYTLRLGLLHHHHCSLQVLDPLRRPGRGSAGEGGGRASPPGAAGPWAEGLGAGEAAGARAPAAGCPARAARASRPCPRGGSGASRAAAPSPPPPRSPGGSSAPARRADVGERRGQPQVSGQGKSQTANLQLQTAHCKPQNARVASGRASSGRRRAPPPRASRTP